MASLQTILRVTILIGTLCEAALYNKYSPSNWETNCWSVTVNCNNKCDYYDSPTQNCYKLAKEFCGILVKGYRCLCQCRTDCAWEEFVASDVSACNIGDLKSAESQILEKVALGVLESSTKAIPVVGTFIGIGWSAFTAAMDESGSASLTDQINQDITNAVSGLKNCVFELLDDAKIAAVQNQLNELFGEYDTLQGATDLDPKLENMWTSFNQQIDNIFRIEEDNANLYEGFLSAYKAIYPLYGTVVIDRLNQLTTTDTTVDHTDWDNEKRATLQRFDVLRTWINWARESIYNSIYTKIQSSFTSCNNLEDLVRFVSSGGPLEAWNNDFIEEYIDPLMTLQDEISQIVWSGCNAIWDYTSLTFAALEAITCTWRCNQVPGRIYQVGSACYLAIGGCDGCLNNPDNHPTALIEVICNPCPTVVDCTSCNNDNGNPCLGEESCITVDTTNYCKPADNVIISCSDERVCSESNGDCLTDLDSIYSFIGCFADDTTRALNDISHGNGWTVAQCAVLCAGSRFFSIQYGSECRCESSWDDVNKYGTSTACTSGCTGCGTYTGGAWANSVYMLDCDVNAECLTDNAWSYVGCYTDASTRAFDDDYHGFGHTVAQCAVKCAGFKFFSIQYGSECFCENSWSDITRYGTSTECTSGCSGCGTYTGGSYANSVYMFDCDVISECSNAVVTSSDGVVIRQESENDDYYHFRICEGSTGLFSCPDGFVLHVGGCWYGSPADDIGYSACPHSAKGDCGSPVGGICMNYIENLCENQNQCSVTINTNNMNSGTDPCPGIYKFGAIALQCNRLPAAKSVELPFIDRDHDNNNNNYIGYDTGNRLSSSIFMVLIICVLVLINILCLCYYNCWSCESRESKYYKVSQIASSED